MSVFGTFRYTYFTPLYDETHQFYLRDLGLKLEHGWDRSEQDKGALFRVGDGLIEVLKYPEDESHRVPGLDYRVPQGVFMGIQVWDIDTRYNAYQAAGIPFKQTIVDQAWGHRSFSITEPNGLVLFFYEEKF